MDDATGRGRLVEKTGRGEDVRRRPGSPAGRVRAARTRRMDVCLALRKVADKRSDDALFAQADELERQATMVRDQRLARLGVKSSAMRFPHETPTAVPSLPTPTDAGFRRVKP